MKISTATENISIIVNKDRYIEKVKVSVDNNKTGNSTVINVIDDNDEEIEESSIKSGFETSNVQMIKIISFTNQLNTMCNPTVAVPFSVENNKALGENKDQLVTWRMKETVDDWNELRGKVKNLIDYHLKVRMIKHTQKERLCITNQGAKRIITNYIDIGKSYKFVDSRENISIIASITSIQFANDSGYQVSIERDVMRDLDLYYPGVE